MQNGRSTHARPRVCRSCETAIRAKPLKSDFRTAREWRERIRRENKLRAHWLIERSYGRYEFQHLCDTVRRHFKVPDVAKWCARAQRNASEGRIKTFVVRGVEEVKASVSVDGRERRGITL